MFRSGWWYHRRLLTRVARRRFRVPGRDTGKELPMCAECTSLPDLDEVATWRQLRLLARGGCLRIVEPGEAPPLTKGVAWAAVERLLEVRPDLRYVRPARVVRVRVSSPRPVRPSDDEIAERILAYVAEHPGVSWSEVCDELHVGRGLAASVRDGLLADGRLVNAGGRRRGWFVLRMGEGER